MKYGVIMITVTLNLRYTVGVVKYPSYAASSKPLIYVPGFSNRTEVKLSN